jgi:hypothetical protein
VATEALTKKPSTSELLDWLKVLMVENVGPDTLRERYPKRPIPPLHGAVLKNEQDAHLFVRPGIYAKREGRRRSVGWSSAETGGTAIRVGGGSRSGSAGSSTA